MTFELGQHESNNRSNNTTTTLLYVDLLVNNNVPSPMTRGTRTEEAEVEGRSQIDYCNSLLVGFLYLHESLYLVLLLDR